MRAFTAESPNTKPNLVAGDDDAVEEVVQTPSLSEMRQLLKGLVEFIDENNDVFSDADRAAVQHIQRKVTTMAVSRIQHLRQKPLAS